MELTINLTPVLVAAIICATLVYICRQGKK